MVIFFQQKYISIRGLLVSNILALQLLWEESPLVLLALGEEKATEKMYLRNWKEDQSNSNLRYKIQGDLLVHLPSVTTEDNLCKTWKQIQMQYKYKYNTNTFICVFVFLQTET